MDDFRHLLEEHARERWPDSVERGSEYGGVELVMADADIYGWALAARDLRLTPDVRSRLRDLVDSLDEALDTIPAEARPYFQRLVRLGRIALGAQ